MIGSAALHRPLFSALPQPCNICTYACVDNDDGPEPREDIELSFARAEMAELTDKNTELENDLHRLYTKMKALQDENAVLRQDFSSESARCIALEVRSR